MRTDKEIREFCRARYYCGYIPSDEGYNQLCETYEYHDKENIDELIRLDVETMKSFMKGGNMVADRHYEDVPDEKLLKDHETLYRAITDLQGQVNIVVRDQVNLLLEYARELTIREVSR